MKSFLMSICIVVCGATGAYAVDDVVEVTPPDPVVDAAPETGSNATGAVILFALIGMVVISGGGGFVTRDAGNVMTIGGDDADDTAGF